jgi:Mrp family chromosome partitioning ATPase
VAVTSLTPAQDTSPTARDLSSALARDGQRVVYVDSDPTRVGGHEAFGVQGGGLMDVLHDKTPLTSAIQPGPMAGLWVLPLGSRSDDAIDLVCSRRMRKVVSALGEAADWVVLDAPPVLACPDSAEIAQDVDRVVLVAHEGRSKQAEIVKAREALRHAGAHVLGLVMVGAGRHASGV